MYDPYDPERIGLEVIVGLREENLELKHENFRLRAAISAHKLVRTNLLTTLAKLRVERQHSTLVPTEKLRDMQEKLAMVREALAERSTYYLSPPPNAEELFYAPLNWEAIMLEKLDG